jgi:hypothetical protein
LNRDVLPLSRDVLLCGPPRSGTTLACWLLNQLADVVALPEPIRVSELMRHGDDIPAAVRVVRDFAAATRRQILSERRATARLVRGALAPNFHEEPRADGQRRSDAGAQRGLLAVEKPLAADFLLVIKHPNPFMGMLPGLLGSFPVYAITRHPLAILGSWNSLQGDFYDGRAPGAEAFAPALRAMLDACADRLERQVLLLAWFFDQLRLLPRDRVLLYEDMIASRGRALRAIEPAAAQLDVGLEAYDPATRYGGAPLPELRRRLALRRHSFEPWYALHDN